MHEQACCCDEAANHQLPIAADFWTIQIVSTEECSSLMPHLMEICCSTHSVILNTTATQYTCSLNSICSPHWLVQWSRHCSCMCIAVHSPWLAGYTDVIQTVLVLLPMAGLFLDRSCKLELSVVIKGYTLQLTFLNIIYWDTGLCYMTIALPEQNRKSDDKPVFFEVSLYS